MGGCLQACRPDIRRADPQVADGNREYVHAQPHIRQRVGCSRSRKSGPECGHHSVIHDVVGDCHHGEPAPRSRQGQGSWKADDEQLRGDSGSGTADERHHVHFRQKHDRIHGALGRAYAGRDRIPQDTRVILPVPVRVIHDIDAFPLSRQFHDTYAGCHRDQRGEPCGILARRDRQDSCRGC